MILKTGEETFSSAIKDADCYTRWVISKFSRYISGEFIEIGFGHGSYRRFIPVVESYAAADIEGYVVSNQIGSNVIGLAIKNIPSGTYGPVAMKGIFLLPGLSGVSVGSIYPGVPVLAGSAGTVVPMVSGLAAPLSTVAGFQDFDCGRSMTTGGDGGDASFVIVSLNI